MVETGTVIDGRYSVLSRIGSGGMADVYLAEDRLLGRKVAVKLLHHRFAQDQEFVERFKREASSAAGLSHPNVVSIYDRGEWDGTYYIAMEYLPGRSLKSVLREHGPLAPQDAIDIVVQILLAVRFAHRRGIIHRDIKPHNVVLDEEGRAKVSDFGIAKAGASDMTLTGSIMGTAQYLSPEQAQGHATTGSSDLYAVGVVLYELLTGGVPFEGDSAVTIALKQVSAQPTPPSQRNAAVGPALDAVVMKALAKEPADRFTSADEFIAALQQAREGVLAPGLASVPNGAATAATALLGPAAVAAAEAAPTVPAAALVAAPAGGPPPPAPLAEDPLFAPDRRRRWWWALAAALVAIAVAVALLLLLKPSSHHGVTVPDVAGRSQQAAVTALRRAGLRPVVAATANASVTVGTAIGTSPPHGASVQRGSTVTVFISTGPGVVALPDVTGQKRADALEALHQKGFKAQPQSQSSETVAKGIVISTSPSPGTELQAGSPVTVFVSSGPAMTKVPDVTGSSEADAKSALEAAGLKVLVQKREVEEPAAGTVISQTPSAGSQLKPGGQVTIVVAQALEQATVPDVVGQSEEEAIAKLSGEGFTAKTVSRAVSEPAKNGIVLQQSPAAGAKRKKGATVTIAVGKLSQTTSTPTTPAPTPPAGAAPAPAPAGGG